MRLALTLSLMLAATTARAGQTGRSPATRATISVQEADRYSERTDRAQVIAMARPVKIWDKGDTGLAECRVISLMKGRLKGKTFRVRFTKVLGNVWPEKGVAALYFLRPPVGGKTTLFTRKTLFELISEKEGLAAPTNDIISVVGLTVSGKYIKSKDRPRVKLDLPSPGSVAGTVLDASYVTVGTVQEVIHTRDPDLAAKIDYRIEKVLKGNIRPGRIFINVPKVRFQADDPKFKPLNPRVGPAVLMFVREAKGGPFETVSAYRGYTGIRDRTAIVDHVKELKEAVEKERRLRKQGLVGNPAGKESVKATLLVWQRSWNKKEAEKCISCYSRRSKWRRKWESGLKGKKELVKVIRDYKARVYAVAERIVERKNGKEALVTVNLHVVTGEGVTDVRTAVMTFVYENGMWLIFREGN